MNLISKLAVAIVVTTTQVAVTQAADLADSAKLVNDRSTMRCLKQAQDAIQEERWADAVQYLKQILEGEQDYFSLVPKEGQQKIETYRSLKVQAAREIANLPNEGQQAYELFYGANSKLLLKEALSNGAPTSLAEVSRRCFHTQAGYEATYRFGAYHMDHARHLEAAICFERLRTSPAARQRFEPYLTLKTAICRYRLGDSESTATAKRLLLELKQFCVDGKIRVAGREPTPVNPSRRVLRLAGKPVALFARDEEALNWVRQWTSAESIRSDESEWLIHKGNPARNAVSHGELPVPGCNWRASTVLDLDDEKLLTSTKQEKRKRGLSTIPSLQLLAVKNTILMRSPEEVVAFDLKSGKRVWDWSDYSQTELLTGRLLTQRVWGNASYGRMSCDGESLYLLTSPGSATYPSKRDNKLISLSLKREGAYRWDVGGQDGGSEKELAGASFLGSPLPMRGRLYVLAELRGEIRLVVLNARDGRLIWQQGLALLNKKPSTRRSGRGPMGVSPSFAGGVMVCPTGVGAVVGVDISTRSFLWGYRYATDSRQQNVGNRWLDPSPMIVDNRVLLSPPESNELHCLDLLTGDSQWTPLSRNDMLYVAGVQDGIAMVVGQQNVRGIRLSDGKPAWEPINLGGHPPSGFGFLSDDHYHLPTSNKELLKISLKAGKLAERVSTDEELGNLICHRDQVLSQSPEWVSSYSQRTPLRKKVAAKALSRERERQLLDHSKDGVFEEQPDETSRAKHLEDSPSQISANLE